jgi:polysaccharide pyruvyl transferase WcaK-like protein
MNNRALLQEYFQQNPAKSLVVCGNYGAGNLGDELILESLLTILRELLPAAEIAVLSGNPEETTSRYQKFKITSAPKFAAGLRSRLRALFVGEKETEALVSRADHFILGGGGLFNNLTTRANYIWLTQAEKALSFNCKLLQVGQSIDEIADPKAALRIAEIFKQSALITLRDQESVANLLKLVPSAPARFAPDFALTESGLAQLAKKEYRLTDLENLDLKAPLCQNLLVALRAIPKYPPDFFPKITAHLQAVFANGGEITFVNFQSNVDHNLHYKIIDLLGFKCQIFSPRTAAELDSIFAKADAVLAMRLHAAITALNHQKPLQIISYDQKVRGMFS